MTTTATVSANAADAMAGRIAEFVLALTDDDENVNALATTVHDILLDIAGVGDDAITRARAIIIAESVLIQIRRNAGLE